MGEVWLAEDTRLDRKVALKLLPAEFTLGGMLKHATTTNALKLTYQQRTEAALEQAKQAIESLNAQGVI